MLTYPNIDPVAFHVFGHPIHWYGIAYLCAFLTAYWLATKRIKRDPKWTADMLSDLLFYSALGVMLGGRVGYVLFYQFQHFLADPSYLFKVWQGGMSFHGGLLGAMLGMILFSRRYAQPYFKTIDLIAPTVPLGLFYGRVANFVNGELYGRVTSSDFPLAMIFPTDPLQLPRHPSQLYEAVLEGIVLFVVLWWFSRVPRPRYAVSGLFLIGYGLARFMVEFLREPDIDQGFILLGWLTKGQLLTMPVILSGVILMAMAYRKPIYGWQMTQVKKHRSATAQ